jgi:hypothetical protein
MPVIEVRLPSRLAARAVAAWNRDEEGPVGPETREQEYIRHLAGDLALLGLAI